MDLNISNNCLNIQLQRLDIEAENHNKISLTAFKKIQGFIYWKQIVLYSSIHFVQYH